MNIQTMNESWGFFGTASANYNLDRDTATEIFAKVAQVIVKEVGCSERKAQCFLDSRMGRHFADAMSFEGIKEGSSTRTYGIVAKKLLRKGDWTSMVISQEIF